MASAVIAGLTAPAAAECHVWWGRAAQAERSLLELCDDDERGRISAYRRQADRDRFIVGCAILRLCGGAYLACAPRDVRVARGCPRCGKPHGKPRLTGPGAPTLQASVSHSGELVVVAFTERVRVGVDIEQLRPDLDCAQIAPAIVAAGERALVDGLPAAARLRALLVLWTRKEALLKAVGSGLRVPPTEIELSGPDDPPRLVAWPAQLDPGDRVALRDLGPPAGYVASLAVLGDCRRVVSFDAAPSLAAAGRLTGR